MTIWKKSGGQERWCDSVENWRANLRRRRAYACQNCHFYIGSKVRARWHFVEGGRTYTIYNSIAYNRSTLLRRCKKWTEKRYYCWLDSIEIRRMLYRFDATIVSFLHECIRAYLCRDSPTWLIYVRAHLPRDSRTWLTHVRAHRAHLSHGIKVIGHWSRWRTSSGSP